MKGRFQLRKQESLAAWLYGVAYRVAVRVRRKSQSRQLVELAEIPQIGTSLLEQMATDQEVALLEQELAQLPEKYRGPLVLHHLQGATLAEVAQAMFLTEGAVDGLLKRGRRELRARLMRKGVEIGGAMAALAGLQSITNAADFSPLVQATTELLVSPPAMIHSTTGPLGCAQEEIKAMLSTSLWKGACCALFATAATVMVPVLYLAGGVSGTSPDQTISSILDVGESQPESLLLFAQNESQSSPSPTRFPGGEAPPPINPSNVNAPKRDERSPRSAISSSGESKVAWTKGDLQYAFGMNNLVWSERELKIWADLEQEITIEFVDTPLAEAIQYFAEVMSIPFRIDMKGLESEGISPDDPVSIGMTASVHRLLLILLPDLGLDYRVENDHVRISTKSICQSKTDTLIYDTSMFEGIDPDDLGLMIQNMVGNPDEWDDFGAKLHLFSNKIVIRHHQAGHRNIRALLTRLAMMSPTKSHVSKNNFASYGSASRPPNNSENAGDSEEETDGANR